MDIFKPSFVVLKRFYKTPEKNLKLILSDFLDREAGEVHQGITRTVYGVIRQERPLDYIIEQFARRKPVHIETDILILLRIGIYLLIFSGSYPDYTVVNEAVHLTRGKAKGFVNAILRRSVPSCFFCSVSRFFDFRRTLGFRINQQSLKTLPFNYRTRSFPKRGEQP